MTKKSKTYKENGVIITVCDPAYADGYVPVDEMPMPYFEPVNLNLYEKDEHNDDI